METHKSNTEPNTVAVADIYRAFGSNFNHSSFFVVLNSSAKCSVRDRLFYMWQHFCITMDIDVSLHMILGNNRRDRFVSLCRTNGGNVTMVWMISCTKSCRSRSLQSWQYLPQLMLKLKMPLVSIFSLLLKPPTPVGAGGGYMFSGRPSVPLPVRVSVRPSVIHVVVLCFRDISSIFLNKLIGWTNDIQLRNSLKKTTFNLLLLTFRQQLLPSSERSD